MKPSIIKNPLKLLTAMILLNAMPSHAIYNLYKSGDFSFDVHGEINTYGQKNSQKYTYLYPETGWASVNNDYEAITKGAYEQRSDRRVRLGQDTGASWTEFRASRKLRDGWRVSGAIGFGYYDSGTGMYLNSANMAFDKKDLGSLSLGRQYLHTGYVTRTNTYTPLETFGENSIRLDYTAIKGLHASGYYSLPASSDVRKKKNGQEVEGFGASVSYLHPLDDHQTVRVALGYSDSRQNAKTTGRDSNFYATKSQGAAASVEYRNNKLLLAADIGQKNEQINGSVTDKSKGNYMGVKVGYEITPRLTMTAGFGKKVAERTQKSGAALIHAYSKDLCVADANDSCHNFVQAYETALFDKIDSKRSYVRADYYLRENVRLYGRIDDEKITNQLGNKDFSKLHNTGYRAGVSFIF